MAVPFRSPSLEHVLRQALKANDLRLRTIVPAEVESYDAVHDEVDCTPCVDGYARDYRERIKPAVRTGVPVIRYGGAGWTVNVPVRQGTQVLLLCCDRGIDDWKERKSKDADPDEGGRQLKDALALPLAFGEDALTAPNADLEVRNYDGSVSLQLTPSGVSARVGNASLSVQGDAVTLRLGTGNNQAVRWTLDGTTREIRSDRV